MSLDPVFTSPIGPLADGVPDDVPVSPDIHSLTLTLTGEDMEELARAMRTGRLYLSEAATLTIHANLPKVDHTDTVFHFAEIPF